MDDFIRQTLKISVAQICDNIGWNSMTDSSMNILTDMLHGYVHDLSVTSKKYAEHAYCDVPDVGDVEKALLQKSVSLADLRRYIKNTAPVKFPHSLPLLNLPGKTSLNTIKPGSREIFTRPIHIHEHLPTIYAVPVKEEEQTNTETECTDTKSMMDVKQEPEEIIVHKRLREISSVVMTSGGFLSPSREGRLAESKLLPFPEVKKEPLKTPDDTVGPELSVILPNTTQQPGVISKKIKTKKSVKKKSAVKNKRKGSKNRLVVKIKDQKPKIVLEDIKEILKDKLQESVDSVASIKKEEIENEIDVVSVPDIVEIPKIVISTSNTNKAEKLEEVLPKFSFFGHLPQGPGLIASTFSQVNNMSNTIENPTATPVLFKTDSEDVNCRKEQKKKRKDKKKEKKEKKKQKEKMKDKGNGKIKEKMLVKVKEKTEEGQIKGKEKENPKRTNKVPKIKLKLGKRIETITTILALEEKSPEKNVTMVSEPEPMEIIDVESDISVNISCDISPTPKLPVQKIKIITKPIQPPIPPVTETHVPPFYYDKGGNQVWICPICTKPDDGSPMIGCDGCDVWYHWVCVGIQCPPDCAVWFCPKCLTKRSQLPKAKRGRPRKNKF